MSAPTTRPAPQTTALAEGLAAIARGWRVFPLAPNKVPFAGTHGFYDATTDADAFRAAMAKHGATSFGIRTGNASGLVVIEADPRDGGDETLAALEAELGPLPPTVEAVSGGGGRHLYFAHPGGHVPGSVGKKGGLGAGVDVRADGQLVVGVGSAHKSGRLYQWEASGHPDDVPLAPLPPRWLARLRLSRLPSNDRNLVPRPAAGPRIANGERNDALFRRLSRFRWAGATDPEVRALAHAANAELCEEPLPDGEVEKIVGSVLRYPAGDVALPAATAPDPDPCEPVRDDLAEARATVADLSARLTETNRRVATLEEQLAATRRRADRAEAEAARLADRHGAVMELLGNKDLNPAERIVTIMALKEIAADDRGDPEPGVEHHIPTERIAERAGVSVGTAAGAVKRLEAGLVLPDPDGGDPVPVRVIARDVKWAKSGFVDPETDEETYIKQTFYSRLGSDLTQDLRTIARAVRVDPRNHGGKREPCRKCGSTRRKSVCADCGYVMHEEPKPEAVNPHDADSVAAAPTAGTDRVNRHDAGLVQAPLRGKQQGGPVTSSPPKGAIYHNGRVPPEPSWVSAMMGGSP